MTDGQFQFVLDATRYIALTTVCLLGLALYNPRLLLRSYPRAIQQVVAPKTTKERWMSLLVGLPFLLALIGFPIYATFRAFAGTEARFVALWSYAFGILCAFNLWDWLVIDWIVFCTFTPRWVVIAGTEGHPAYKDYFFHFKGFLLGIAFSGGFGAVSAGVAVAMRAQIGG
jgi:hypothetical protein